MDQLTSSASLFDTCDLPSLRQERVLKVTAGDDVSQRYICGCSHAVTLTLFGTGRLPVFFDEFLERGATSPIRLMPTRFAAEAIQDAPLPLLVDMLDGVETRLPAVGGVFTLRFKDAIVGDRAFAW